MRVARVIVAVGVAAGLVAPAICEADEFEAARTRIRRVMAMHHVPSISVVVTRKGETVWQESFGWSDVGRKTRATPDTRYAIASISKPVTATALMVLVERGAIDLQRPIDQYLGPQKITAHVGHASEATVARVASHTAGLPLHSRYFYADEGTASPSLDETIRRYGVVVNTPGDRHEYSNMGYGLIERAIENVSGRRYTDFVAEEVFAPLHLSSAVVDPGPDDDVAVAARYWTDGRQVPFYDFDQLGGGGVFMSARDAARFGMFHLYGRPDHGRAVVSPTGLKSMQHPVDLNDGTSAGYGLGWFTGERHGLRWFGHNGGMAGVASVLSVYPDEELVVVILANGVARSGAIHFLEDDIVHAVLPQTIRKDHGFVPPAVLAGRWVGEVVTYVGPRRAELDLLSTGEVFFTIGESARREVAKVKYDPRTQTLTLDDLDGRLGTPDADLHPGFLQLSLKVGSDGRLRGALSSNSLEIMGDRLGSAMSYWVHFERVAGAP